MRVARQAVLGVVVAALLFAPVLWAASEAFQRGYGDGKTFGERMGKNKEHVLEAGVLVLHTAETQGTLVLSSMAEGYFGGDKLKVGG
ncbi:MAG: hypothetical protein HY815_05500, partial [Candidatus Riflebacteria bacterium]|nr:hypothetical protein [Candidatus Riflebacteria bacterium]